MSEIAVPMDCELPPPRQLRETFDGIASRYDDHAALEQEVGTRLLERLAFLRVSVQRVVDLGCGTGVASAELKKKYPRAQVIGLDSSRGMLNQLQRRSGLLRPLKAVCADFSELPLAERSVDLVYSNLAFQWCANPIARFAEIRRILRPGGMLLFSSLGPGSLRELDAAWSGIDETAGLTGFTDILDLGDALMAAGFQEPVMDAERITLSYPHIAALADELESTGTSGFLRGGPVLRESHTALEAAYEGLRVDGRYPVSYELVYGTAFGPQEGQPRKTEEGEIATFSVESLRKTNPKRSE
jgi:malonyl-CoA O-methyltransferase